MCPAMSNMVYIIGTVFPILHRRELQLKKKKKKLFLAQGHKN